MLGADEDAIAFLQAPALDLLAVHERSVRRAQIFDPDLIPLASRCARAFSDTMSSTRTMSRSLGKRPTRICLSAMMWENSPPWYLPLMKRKTNDLPPGRGAGVVVTLGEGSCNSLPAGTSVFMPPNTGARRGCSGCALRENDDERPAKRRLMVSKLSGQVRGVCRPWLLWRRAPTRCLRSGASSPAATLTGRTEWSNRGEVCPRRRSSSTMTSAASSRARRSSTS